MAISARFSADFSSFNDAVNKAEIELRGFEGAAGKVESALSRMTDNFSGRKIITDATLMAQAVENVGGVTKLTAAELAKVGASAQEAAAKFRAWGQDVPPRIQAIADTVKEAESSTKSWASQLGNLAGAFGITLGAAGIIGFAKSLLDTGDELVRVADRTGLTTIEVQKLQFIAGQSGNTIDELTGAIGKLQKNLTTGEQGAVAAVHQLGLNLEDLKTKSPYDQMAAIAEAIEKVPDPAERATLAIQLFGKNGAAILPTLVAQFKELGDAAPVMSDSTVRALDRAGDAMNTFGQVVKVRVAEAIASAADAFKRATPTMLEFASALMPSITNQKLLTDQAKTLRDHMDDVEPVVRKTAAAFGDFEPKAEKATKAVKEHDAAIIGLGASEKFLQDVLKLQQDALQRYYERLEQIIPAQRDWWNLIAQTDGEINVLASHSIPKATGALVDLGSGVVHLGDQINAAMKPATKGWQGLTMATMDWGTTLKGVGEIAAHVSGTIADLTSIGSAAALAFMGSTSLFQTIIIGATLAIQVISKLWDGIRQLFGGPSKDELAARDEFAKSFESANQALDVLGKKFADAGIDGETARELIQKLFDATHDSAKAVDDAMQAINDRIAQGANAASSAINGVTDSVTKLGSAVDNLPTSPYQGFNVDSGSSYGSTGGYVTPSGIQHFAGGGRVLPFMARGTDTVPAMLTPGEVVLTKNQQANWGGGGTVVIQISDSVITNDASLRQLAQQISDAQNDQYRNRRKVRAA